MNEPGVMDFFNIAESCTKDNVHSELKEKGFIEGEVCAAEDGKSWKENNEK